MSAEWQCTAKTRRGKHKRCKNHRTGDFLFCAAHLRIKPYEPELTSAQLAYLKCFDDWLMMPTPGNQRRREFSLDLLLTEADIDPESGPSDSEMLDELVTWFY